MSRVCLFMRKLRPIACSKHHLTIHTVDNKMQIANISFRPKHANGKTELFAPRAAAAAHHPRIIPHKRSLTLARHR